MALPNIILVPTDFSECSAAALGYALDLATAAQGRIILTHAYQTPAPLMSPALLARMPEFVGEILRTAESEMDKFKLRASVAQVPVETVVREGDTRDVIFAVLRETKAQLICMGTHGRRGVARTLIGSVAENIVRTSPVPVLTVHRSAS
ncbi:MAG: universal stress protein [Polyangiaceae bacterium]